MKLLGGGEYVLDVTTELEGGAKDFFLLLKRTVWIHPLRRDHALYVDVMFFQVMIMTALMMLMMMIWSSWFPTTWKASS